MAYAACLTLFVLANRLTTAANTIFLQSTAPLYLLILAPWLLKEPVRRRDVGFMLVVGARPDALLRRGGAAGGDGAGSGAGNFWRWSAVSAGRSPCCGLRWLSAGAGRGSPMAAVTSGNLIAFLVTLPFALPLGAHSVADWSVLVYLGVFQIALAYVLVTSAINHIPALEASVILLIEPALNPVWAWLVQGEVPGHLGHGSAAPSSWRATTAKSWTERRVEAPVT